MDVLVWVLVASAAILAVAFLATYKRGPEVLAFAIGVSAGFILLQVQGVHIYTMLVLTYIVLSRTTTNTSLMPRVVTLSIACLLMSLTAFIGDLTTGQGLGIQLILLTLSTGLFILRADPAHLHVARSGLLLFVTVGSLTAIGQAFGIVPAQLFQLEGAESYRPSSIYPEPDWLGLYSAAGVVLATIVPVRRRWQVLLVSINAFGTILASARAAVVALAVVAMWALVRSLASRKPGGPPSRRLSGIIVLFIALAGFLLASVILPDEVDLLINRMSNALVVGGGDAVTTARYAQIDGLREMFDSAPWYGHGLSASGRVDGFGIIHYEDVQGSTGTNWFFSLLAEGKLLALPMIAALTFWAAFGNRKGSYLLMLILVDSLFSNALFFPLTWFAIAMCLVPERQPVDSVVTLETTKSPRSVHNVGERTGGPVVGASRPRAVRRLSASS